MERITHRELRNNSSEILRKVRAGASFEVTNNGEVAALLVPPAESPYERLVTARKVRLASGSDVDLRRIARRRASVTSAALIADVRGEGGGN